MASKTNPFTFLQQVRAETAKVKWPSRRETSISTIMVLVMVLLASHVLLCGRPDLTAGAIDLVFGPTR
jgi:preprotein translocase SecE subunit